MLLPSRDVPSYLMGSELPNMNATLTLEAATRIPDAIHAKKYFRLQLPNGVLVGSSPSSSDDDTNKRRKHYVRVQSTARRRRQDGLPEVYELSTNGLVHPFALVLVKEQPRAFAYIECIKSVAYRSGRYDQAEPRREMDCFVSFWRAPSLRRRVRNGLCRGHSLAARAAHCAFQPRAVQQCTLAVLCSYNN